MIVLGAPRPSGRRGSRWAFGAAAEGLLGRGPRAALRGGGGGGHRAERSRGVCQAERPGLPLGRGRQRPWPLLRHTWLDWGRLEEVRGRISASLSLHGASGLPEADLERAVSLGVAKFNVNTERRTAYFRCLGPLGAKAATVDLKGLGDGVVAAVQEVVEAKLSAFGWTREEA